MLSMTRKEVKECLRAVSQYAGLLCELQREGRFLSKKETDRIAALIDLELRLGRKIGQ